MCNSINKVYLSINQSINLLLVLVLKSVEFDNDVALLLSIAGLVNQSITYSTIKQH